jgi:hypothetical protein
MVTSLSNEEKAFVMASIQIKLEEEKKQQKSLNVKKPRKR